MRFQILLSLSATVIGIGSATPIAGRGSNESQAAPVVRLPSPADVTFQGITAHDVDSFLNIKFGADTAGDNRFAPPQPYTYSSGSTVDASHPGAACPQSRVPLRGFSLLDNVTDVSEDCLTLRVDRPAGTKANAKLPVMVYIYGGGDTIGQIYDGAYDPTLLVSAAAKKDFPIIYAAVNYRVNIFGFAASEALSKADSLNAGLLDQRLGLEWIQDNIASFGGDPEKVTIFGESDGATGVGLQITAYGGQKKAPFKRAIMESGGPTADPGTASNFSTIHTAKVTELVNCTSSSSSRELSCLRKVPMKFLLATTLGYADKVDMPWAFDVFIPTAPSSFIPDSPSTLLRQGRFAHDIDIISGWNEDDGSLFTSSTVSSLADIWKSVAFAGLTDESKKLALQLYPLDEFTATKHVSAQYFRASRMTRDAGYTCPNLFLARANAKYSAPTTGNYLYALNQTVFKGFFEEAHTPYYGVSHFSDIAFVFNEATTRFVDTSTPSDDALSNLMSGSWAAFASSGHPSGLKGTLSGWHGEGDGETTSVQIIGGPLAGSRSLSDYERLVERCEFWNSPEVTSQLRV